MFYPARMNSVVIGIHTRWLMDVTTALHKEGNVEVLDLKKTSGEDIPKGQLSIPREEIEKIISLQFRSDRVLEILEPYIDKPEGLKSVFFPEEYQYTPAIYDSPDQIFRAAEEELKDTESAVGAYEALKRNQELEQETLDRINSLNRLNALDLDLSNFVPTPYTYAVAGWVYPESLSLLDEWLRTSGTDEIYLHKEKKGQEIIVFCISTRRFKPLLEELTHYHWFSRIIPPETYEGLPAAMIVSEKNLLDKYKIEKERLVAHLVSLAEHHILSLRAIREELSIWRYRFEVSRNFGRSRDVVYLKGWIRQKDTEHLSGLLQKVTNDEYFLVFRPTEPEDDVPVRYDNPNWLKPFELLTTTFSRPRYNEIDPTPFFAPAYLLFFGMMLGDAGYGIIIALAGWLLYRGPGKNDASFRDMSFILLCSGVADIILGTIQGGWFGDLLPRFFHIQPPFVLIEPLITPILLFQAALVIGTIHINLGLVLGLWENVRNRMYMTAFQEQAIWFILQPAAAVLLIEFFGWMTFPAFITTVATVGAIFGLAVLFLKKGPMGFFSLTGFLGDWLSYVRILALALATGGVAMTINILSEMIASVHPFMIIPAILFCIAGQIFNLAIQTLGSVIHALRLHYIEFFGKFYSGGGREFIPFRENRIVTQRKGEDIL